MVIDDEAAHGDAHAKLHGHLVELLHGRDSGKVDHRELARQLRRLADRLESESQPAKADPRIRRRVEVQRKTDHPVELDFTVGDVDFKNRVIRVEVDPAKNRFLHKKDETRQRVIEMKKDERGDLHFGDKEHNRFVYRDDKIDPERNATLRWVFKNEDDQAHEAHDRRAPHEARKPHEEELHFGHATTSDGELGQVLRELKNEVQQLRREVNQLRSGRDLTTDRPVRFHVEERKIHPDRPVELRRFREDRDVETDYEFRVKPKGVEGSSKKSGGVRIESKTKPGNVWFDSKTKPKNIWIESEPKAENIEKAEPKRRAKRDDNVRFDVEVKANSTVELPNKKGIWVVEVEDVKQQPNSQIRLKRANEGKKTSDSEGVLVDVEFVEDIAKDRDETKSSKSKKKK